MLWIPVVLVGVAAGLLLLDAAARRSRVWRRLQQFPGEPALPLLGNALDIGFTPEVIQKNLERMWKKFGMQNFRVMMGLDPMLFICNADDVKKILCTPNQVKPDLQLCVFRECFGDSLVLSSGEKYTTVRRLLTPLFQPSCLSEHLKGVNRLGAAFVHKLRQRVDQPSFDIHPLILDYGLGVVLASLFGTNSSMSEWEQKYITASRKVLPNVMKRFYSPWLRYDFIYEMSPLSRESKQVIRDMNTALRKIIADRREYLAKQVTPQIENEEEMLQFISKNKKLLTFVDVMLLSKMPDGKPISEQILMEEANVMLFAGFDTNVATIGYAIYNLAVHPELQEKVYEEQLAIFRDDPHREPTPRDLNQMHYLTRFIKESMRYHPTVGQFGRKITSDLELDDGRVLAAGTNVLFYTNGIYRNPKYFKEPEKFDPDRFLESYSPYLYMPFSAGPRICLGMNYTWMWIRAILSTLVRCYRFTHSGRREDEARPVFQIVSYSSNGIRVGLVERNTPAE